MNRAEILTMLKVDLQISTAAQDAYLGNLITLAQQSIRREGITLANNIEDSMLTEAYAAYLYRSRRNPAPMPRNLRWALNNRLLAEKAGDSNG